MKAHLSFRFLVLAFLALAASGLTSALADTVTLTPQEQIIANHLVTDPGQQRPFLHLDATLTKVARARAADMAARGYFDHVDPNGIGPDYKVVQAGYPLPSTWINPVSLNYIESIAAGESSADATWNDWMNSAPHKTHLLAQNSAFAQETSYGVGYANAPGSQYTYYWVVITCPPAPAPPAITVSSPATNASVTNAQVSVSGTTSGDTAAQSVIVRVENSAGNSAYQTASGTTNWSSTLAGLVPGPNTIRAESLGAGSAVLAQTTQVVNYIVDSPLTVSVNGQGTVTAAYLGTTQRALGFRDTITATPATGWLFTGWTGTVTGTTAALGFTMTAGQTETANFVLNPFTTRKGVYSGLLEGSGAGLVKVTVGGTGVFTGRVQIDGHSYSIRGRLAADGTGTVTIPRHGLPSITVSFNLDVNASNGLTGTVNDGTTTDTFGATQSYQTSAGRFASAGRYTVSLPSNTDGSEAGVPQGNGYGTMTVNGAGQATLAASVSDGRTFTGSALATADGSFVFYVPMYGNEGGVFGKVTLRSTDVSDLDGSFRWIKPARPTDPVSPTAFDTTVPVIGSHYTAPARNTPVIPVAVQDQDNSQLLFSAGNLSDSVVQPATLDAANQILVVKPTLNGLTVTINSATGLYAGSFIHPVTGVRTRLHGVIFQKQGAGYGYFLGQSASGSTSLEVTP